MFILLDSDSSLFGTKLISRKQFLFTKTMMITSTYIILYIVLYDIIYFAFLVFYIQTLNKIPFILKCVCSVLLLTVSSVYVYAHKGETGLSKAACTTANATL